MLPDVALLWDMTSAVQLATSAWGLLVALGSPGDILHWQLLSLALPGATLEQRVPGGRWDLVQVTRAQG